MQYTKKYKQFFDDKAKIEAFDKIADEYYEGNFGTMGKSDFETLLFSIYIDRVIDANETEDDNYSNYELSKQLGVPESKINNLKIRKQLKYPRKYNWQEAFCRHLKNAVFEKGKIKIQIQDPNLYIEVKHAVDLLGGFVDSSFNSKIMIISPSEFLDLICLIAGENKIDEMKTIIQENLKKENDGIDFLTTEPFSKQLKKEGISLSEEMLFSVLSAIPGISGLSPVLKKAVALIKSYVHTNKLNKKFKGTKK